MSVFRLRSIAFHDGENPIADFEFGDELDTLQFGVPVLADMSPTFEEAVAVAAQMFADELREWAAEAERFAAGVRAGSLRAAPTDPSLRS